MPKSCSVCNHECRVEIDYALLTGELAREVSERFDRLSEPQIKGHRRSGHHLAGCTPSRRSASHTAADLLSRIEDNLDDGDALRSLRLAASALPPEERILLIAELRRRSGRGKVGALTRVA